METAAPRMLHPLEQPNPARPGRSAGGAGSSHGLPDAYKADGACHRHRDGSRLSPGLTFLSKGDHMVASEVCYAGSVELFGLHLPRFGIEVSLVDTSDPEQVRAALRPNTKTGLRGDTRQSHPAHRRYRRAGRHRPRSRVQLAVDSTWASPALQKPFDLGADFVIHSLTKYMNGHGDALGGVVLGREEDILKIRRDMLVHLGGAMSPFKLPDPARACTLPLRMQQHCENAIKVADPYLRPLYDALFDMMDAEKSAALPERGVIEIAPLAYMRGRTLNDSFVILDEAQNTTPEQMKMFLTRLGFGSKIVITGDVTQIDLPRGHSGLKQVRDILDGVADIAFVELTGKDVVRHKLVQRIVTAYTRHEEALALAEEAKAQPRHEPV